MRGLWGARVLRGGSWNNESTNLRAPNRVGVVPDVRNAFIGFRCAHSL
ncbi:MAG: SUMF1/EgtB/PvdO family nonheme iron enzyme [Anaerolineae bacterium]|nr:SUMF1/EgtB/PvdO family nonheme iron enzyme [Anaerolineae bacterium]